MKGMHGASWRLIVEVEDDQGMWLSRMIWNGMNGDLLFQDMYVCVYIYMYIYIYMYVCMSVYICV